MSYEEFFSVFCSLREEGKFFLLCIKFNPDDVEKCEANVDGYKFHMKNGSIINVN